MFIFIQFVVGCQLSGYESGVCRQKSNITIEFCGAELDDYICVPEERELWPNHTIAQRDQEIRIDFMAYIRDRFVQEIEGTGSIVLIQSDACYKAYKQFICQWNFPPCNGNVTKSICQSYCTSYYDSCGLNLTPCLQSFQKLKPGLDQSC